ncbi:MAG: hypothetical protein ABI467_12810 [Kofleriaceae bacterium]
MPTPWFVQSEELFLIASPTRLFCMDRRRAIRWCWNVRAETTEWMDISAAPSIAGSQVVAHVKVRERNSIITFDEFGLALNAAPPT